MKKLNYLFASLFIVAALASCSKEATDDSELGVMLKAGEANIASTPVSDGGIIPYIIPGVNRGGNRTCAEVATAFNTSFDLCGDKLNYGDYDWDGDYEFDGAFPEGLNVTVDGNFISFEMGSCIAIGDNYYKVGAVIVKGSAAANVYYYPDGSMGDSGLAAPGGNRMVSNLTFCFVKCEQPDLVIAFKGQVSGGYARTVGTEDFYIDFVPDYVGNKIYWMGDINVEFGNINVADIDGDGDWEVTVDNTNMPDSFFIYEAYLFVGTLEEFIACSSHYDYPYSKVIAEPSASLTFDLPF